MTTQLQLINIIIIIIIIRRRFGTLCLFHLHRQVGMLVIRHTYSLMKR